MRIFLDADILMSKNQYKQKTIKSYSTTAEVAASEITTMYIQQYLNDGSEPRITIKLSNHLSIVR